MGTKTVVLTVQVAHASTTSPIVRTCAGRDVFALKGNVGGWTALLSKGAGVAILPVEGTAQDVPAFKGSLLLGAIVDILAVLGRIALANIPSAHARAQPACLATGSALPPQVTPPAKGQVLAPVGEGGASAGSFAPGWRALAEGQRSAPPKGAKGRVVIVGHSVTKSLLVGGQKGAKRKDARDGIAGVLLCARMSRFNVPFPLRRG